MQIEKRPWIPIPKLELVELKFQPNGRAWITIKRTAKNTGSSPALNITEKFGVDIMTDQNAFERITVDSEICQTARREALNDPTRGRAVFPGDTDEEQNGTGVGHQKYKFATPKADRLIFKIYGCIDYMWGNEPSRHGLTSYMYQLSRSVTGDTLPHGFDPTTGPWGPGQARFERDYFHGGYVQ